MNFTEMVRRVASIVNISSDDGLARIGDTINERYRQVCKAVGIAPSIVWVVATANTTVGNRQLTFGTSGTPVTKLMAVYDATANPVRELTQISLIDMRNTIVGTADPATEYAVELSGSQSVTVLLNTTPQSIYTLTADAETVASRLTGVLIPAFDPDFHDILTYAGISVEYGVKGNRAESERYDKKSTARLNELGYQLAVSATLDLVVGSSRQRRLLV